MEEKNDQHLAGRAHRIGRRRRFQAARPPPPVAQPGHVRRRDRLCCHNGHRRYSNLFLRRAFLVRLQISIWLWFTVLFATFAEALAEGKGKAQAETLQEGADRGVRQKRWTDGRTEKIPALSLSKGDIVLMEDNDPPGDGEIVEGVALVDESAVTGESAPVIREAGKGDRTAVTGGTRMLSGKIKAMITANPGETFIDHMISMVESAETAEDAE